ncbi:uncharacterized protein [Mobula birostris]|uniref:uncharacterized protein n=1 Tax=Mobula birostris TaxID=1983395 RepID=UPI003B28969A
MRKSGPGETLSRLLRRRSSPSLYTVAPVSDREPDKLNEISVLTSGEGAPNAIVDSGTAKVKQRPTVKLGIPFLDRPKPAVPTPNLQDQILLSMIPRTMIVTGNDGKSGIDQPILGGYGNGIAGADDEWIPPPPPMAPPPPPPPPVQSPHSGHLPYDLTVPPPPNMAPPPPPPHLSSHLQQHPNLPAPSPLPDNIHLPAPAAIPLAPPLSAPPAPPLSAPPGPPLMAPQKTLPTTGHYPRATPPVLLPSDYVKVHSETSRASHIRPPKKQPPPPPQRDLTHPPKPERHLPFGPNSSQIAISNTISFLADPPEPSKVASTFNPKATAKLYGFSDPVNGPEASAESDRKVRGKSTIVMQDAKPFSVESAVHQKMVMEGSGEYPVMSKAQADSSASRPQKPARRSQAVVQPKSGPNIPAYLPVDYLVSGPTENHWNGNADVQQAGSNQVQDSNNNQTFTNLPISGKPREEERGESSEASDFGSRSSSGSGLSDFPYVKLSAPAARTADLPDSLSEPTQRGLKHSAEARSPLALLMAAKQRDLKNKTPKSSSDAPTLSMGGTRYIKSTNPNSFQIMPRLTYQKQLLLGEQDITTPSEDGDGDVPPGGAERSLNLSEFSFPRVAELESSHKDEDMSSLLLPPPPLFSDEDNEEFPLPFLPPPAEFSNDDDNGSASTESEREGSRSDSSSPSVQGPTYERGGRWTSPHRNSPASVSTHLTNRPSINASSSVSNSNGLKPLLAPKPSNAALNTGSSKLHISNHLLAKAHDRNVPRLEQKQSEARISPNGLLAKSNLIGELQSKVQTLSTQSDAGSKSFHSTKFSQFHGKTFTVRPGTKQPITVVGTSTTK